MSDRSAHSPEVIILEPNLVGLAGHYFNSSLEVIRAVAPAQVAIAVPIWAGELPFPAEIRVHRLFRSNELDLFNLGPRPPPGLMNRLHRSATSVNRMLRRLQVYATETLQLDLLKWPEWPEMHALVEQSGCLDAKHIVLPTATPSMVWELQAILNDRPTSTRPYIHARFMGDTTTRIARRIRHLAERIAAQPKEWNNVFIYVETPTMQRFLLEQDGLRSDLFPYILNAPPGDSLPMRRAAQPISFALLGTPRAEKGTGRLVAIMEELAKDTRFRAEDVVFICQVDHAGKGARIISEAVATAAKRLGIQLETVPISISNTAYQQLLARVDCMLLPYVSERYRRGGSGVLSEALANGKPLICSAGFAFADHAHAGMIEARDDAEFAEAILKFASDPAPYQMAALEAASGYLEGLRNGSFLTRIRSR